KALHRLETAGCVAGDWGISDNGRRARYYRLTTRGRARLKSGDAHWRRYASAVFRVLDAT
ncbi:MAG TPA: helix-turn-helix transcriptional regulator, partial [Gemmatimonadaceae bacterium]|nr:helix-turn-helix transcriptional regulator [Gemmatimonadaceae bacterium]